MNSTIQTIGNATLGLSTDAKDLLFHQLIFRAFIVFFCLLLIIRLSGRRFLADRNPLDALLIFILASMLARAVNGNTPFLPTLGTGFFLAALYRFVAYLACRFHAVGRLLKGSPVVIIENGRLNRENLRRHHVSEHDLMEDLRLNGNINNISDVALAHIERNGAIGVVLKKRD